MSLSRNVSVPLGNSVNRLADPSALGMPELSADHGVGSSSRGCLPAMPAGLDFRRMSKV